MTNAERQHLTRVKELSCGLCGATGPSDAHHVRTGQGMSQRAGHYCTIPLCKACHTERDGLHGTRNLWKVYRRTELDVLDETIGRLMT